MRRSQIGEALLLQGKVAGEQRPTSEAMALELDDVSPSQSLLGAGPKASRPVNAGAVLVCYVLCLIGEHKYKNVLVLSQLY